MKTKPAFRLAFPLASAIAVLLTAQSAQAITYYWDNNAATAGFGSAGGTWISPTVSQWTTTVAGNVAPGASITTSTSDALHFGTDTAGQALGAGTITVSGMVNAASLRFGSQTTGNVILSGGTINLAAATSIHVGAGGTTNHNISSSITGAGTSLTKTGNTLTLSGANSYTGTTIISSGNLILSNLSALGSTTGITLGGATAATIQTTTEGITITAPITTANTGINSNIVFGRATAAVGSINLNGAIGGAGNVIYSTPNASSGGQIQTVNLGAAGNYAGSTTITTGNINNSTTIRNNTGAVNALPTATVLTLDGANGTGSGRTVTFDLNGQNQTLAGLTNNTTRTLRNQRVSNSGALATLTINNTTDFAYGGLFGSQSAQITDAIALTKNGVGTFTLSAGTGNTFTGATTVSGGILSVGHPTSLQNSAFDTTSSIAGTTTGGLRTTATTLTLGGLTGGNDFSTRFTTTSGGYINVTALTLNPGTGATPSYSGAIADGTAGMTLTKTGAGTQTLSGANTFTGATAVNVGTLTLDYSTQDNSKLSDTAALTLGAATLNLSGGTHLEIVNSTTLTDGTASSVTRSSGSAILQMNAITNGALASVDFSQSGIATTDTLNNANGILGPWATIGGTDFAVNSTNSPDGLITAPTNTDVPRLNGGTQVIPNSAASSIRITEGSGSPANITLAAATTTISTLTQSASGGNSAATINSGGQTLLTSAILVGTGAGDLTIGNGTLGSATAGGDLALVNSTASGFTVNSVIANNTSASTLTKLGTGSVTLTNANTYTGATTISVGTLQLGAGGTTGSLDTTGAITLANSANLTINRSNAVTQGTDFSAAPITGTGSFTQAGAGTTTLNAINTYSKPTTIAAGTLNANTSDALGSGVSGNTLIFTGGSLQAGGAITSPSTRAVNFTSTGVIDTNGNDVSFAGVASGVGGLTKNGAGTLSSSAFNTFTGPITINGGTMEFTGAGSGNNPYLSTQININNGAILRITGATSNQPIYNGRNYTFDSMGGGSILVSTGNYNAVSTPFSITTNGGAQNTIGLITTSGTNGFNLGATTCTFDVALGSDANSDLTVAPIIANTGSILKTGAGRLTITGVNTYTGATTINAGKLEIGATGSIATSTSLTIAAGATLDTDAQATYTLLAAQPLALGINASASGSSGKIAAASLDITNAVVTYNITGTPDDPVYVLATYTSLTGAFFASVPTPPAGYTLQYAFEGNKIALVQSASTYASWINGFFLGETNPLIIGAGADPDNDGIGNAAEMVLGGNPATGMDTALLPTIELVTNPVSIPAIPAGNYLLFTYRRSAISETALVAAACETDTDLVAPWTTAINAVSGVVIQEDLNFSFTPAAPADTDRVRVYVPRGANTKLFGRLNVVVP